MADEEIPGQDYTINGTTYRIPKLTDTADAVVAFEDYSNSIPFSEYIQAEEVSDPAVIVDDSYNGKMIVAKAPTTLTFGTLPNGFSVACVADEGATISYDGVDKEGQTTDAYEVATVVTVNGKNILSVARATSNTPDCPECPEPSDVVAKISSAQGTDPDPRGKPADATAGSNDASYHYSADGKEYAVYAFTEAPEPIHVVTFISPEFADSVTDEKVLDLIRTMPIPEDFDGDPAELLPEEYRDEFLGQLRVIPPTDPGHTITLESGGFVDVLLVAGGAGGAGYNGESCGGGGAGGFVETNVYLPKGESKVTVGRYGRGGWGTFAANDTGGHGYQYRGEAGFPSILGDYSVPGGGGGGMYGSGNQGASGGGGGYWATSVGGVGGDGFHPFGNAGGKAQGSPAGAQSNGSGGGGGGAGSAGGDGVLKEGGNGGDGKESTILGGDPIFWAAGGGGDSKGLTPGQGGSEIGGTGGSYNTRGENAVEGTGSGGGGGNYSGNSTTQWGGNGSSGIVVVRVEVTE